MLVRRVVVEGFVQGVGYREFTRRAADRLKLTGWVRNRTDGAVEALIQGAPADVEALIAEMRLGPRGAGVTALRVLEANDDEDAGSASFIIRPTR
jgi:acylphosphatase